MYRDFSQVKDNQPKKKSGRQLFPTILHDFVSDPQTNDIITWLPHGRSFMILNRDEIESDYFRLTQIKSLIRQLNGWGFHRVSDGSEKGAYFHEVRIIVFGQNLCIDLLLLSLLVLIDVFKG